MEEYERKQVCQAGGNLTKGYRFETEEECVRRFSIHGATEHAFIEPSNSSDEEQTKFNQMTAQDLKEVAKELEALVKSG